MSLQANLAAAWRAVRHVRGTLGLVAANRDDDLAATGGASAQCVAGMHADFDQQAKSMGGSFVETLAAFAGQHGCANCVGMSAAALVYLRDVEQIAEVRLGTVSLGRADHVFVIVGGGSSLRPQLFKTWGSDAAICDPWDRQAYPATEYPARIKETLSRVAVR